MKSSSEKVKVLNYVEYLEERKNDNDIAYEIMGHIKEAAKKEAVRNADAITQNEIQRLKKEVDMMSIKLSRAFPTALVVFLCIYCAIAFSSAGLFFIQLTCDIKVLDFYILLLLFASSFGLAITAISTIKEFRKKINV